MGHSPLLNDQRMQAFIRQGYVVLKPDFPPEFHACIYQRVESTIEQSGNPGNNLLPRIPEVHDILTHPTVHGALTSLLGSTYFLHPHRHCHFNPPKSDGQGMHKDSWSKRHHRMRWAMAFYYPQDTPADLGPTGIVDGSHYYNDGPSHGRETPLTGEAGTVVLVHYDLWHRATPNLSDKKRFMLKFLFTRLDEPEQPAWQSESGGWSSTGEPLEPLWQNVWNWQRGQPDAEVATNGSVSPLALSDGNGDETSRFHAAYALGGARNGSVGPLADLLRSDDPVVRRNAGYGLTAAGASATGVLVDLIADPATSDATRASALDCLANIGKPASDAVPTLGDSLTNVNPELRRAAADALGLMKEVAPLALNRLGKALHDPDEWVSRNAALALARLGKASEPVSVDLVKALRHTNRTSVSRPPKPWNASERQWPSRRRLTFTAPMSGARSRTQLRHSEFCNKPFDRFPDGGVANPKLSLRL